MTTHDRQLHHAAHVLAPTLLLSAVAIVIVAQFWRIVPLAGAIGLAAWGAALAAASRRERFWLALVVYAPLVALAVAAQLDAAATSGSLIRQFLTAMDAGVGAALLAQLFRRGLRT